MFICDVKAKESTESVSFESPKQERLQRQAGVHHLEQLANQPASGKSQAARQINAGSVWHIYDL